MGQMQQTVRPAAQREDPKALAAYFRERLSGLTTLAPKGFDPERFSQQAIVAISENPRLLSCSRASLLVSVKQAIELGLDLSPRVGQCYIIPYRIDGRYVAQLQIGYRGMIQLATRHPRVLAIEAHLVGSNDEFECYEGTEPRIFHKRPHLTQDRGDVIGAYAVATLAGGVKQAEVMSIAELNAIRDRSRAKDDGPWVTDEREMQRKCPVRRLFKYLPMSIDLGKAIERTDDDGVIDTTAREVEEGEDAPKQGGLGDALEDAGRDAPPVETGMDGDGFARRTTPPPQQQRVNNATGPVEISTEDIDAAFEHAEPAPARVVDRRVNGARRAVTR